MKLAITTVCIVTAAALGCSAGGTPRGGFDSNDPTTGAAASGAPGSPGALGGPSSGSNAPSRSEGTALLYAHTDTTLFGFSHSGDIIEIHSADGTGCLIRNEYSTKFAGAGITTAAPVVAPPAVN